MRIAFLGKGGSGKTTLATIASMFSIHSGRTTLTIDGDVNMHLGPALGVKEGFRPLGDDYAGLFRLLEGRHPYFARIGVVPGCGSVPPSRWSNHVRLNNLDPVLRTFAWHSPQARWWHVALGNYGTVESGGDCYHFKQNALELFVHRIADERSEVVLADATAGIDHLATSLVRGYDLCVMSVEPTRKSITVASDFRLLAEKADIAVVYVANKVESESDVQFIEQSLMTDVFGVLAFIEGLGRSDEEDQELLNNAASCESALFEKMFSLAENLFDKRAQQVAHLPAIYRRECEGYWNAALGVNLIPYLEQGV